MRIICLTGMDGAGKTTLARNLVSRLAAGGVDVVYVYGRTFPVISRLLMAAGRMTLLRKNDQWQNYQAYNNDKKQKMRHPMLRIVYTAAILIDYYTQIWFKLLPHLLSQRVVVCDRYIYDTVISDLTVHLGYTENQTRRAIARGLKWLPIPFLTALLDLPEDVAFARKDDMPHVDYLHERRGWYLQLASRPEVVKFRADAAPEAVLDAVFTQIRQQQTKRVLT
ncbi:MAG: hypothetical protein KC419_13070 [Anaerolineales bacterium]|nr:hypothetical protein [Anaerolineales bacterium]